MSVKRSANHGGITTHYGLFPRDKFRWIFCVVVYGRQTSRDLILARYVSEAQMLERRQQNAITNPKPS